MSSKPSIPKKRGRVVPSRFKQAAENFSGQSTKRSEEQSRFQSRSYSPRRVDKESRKQLPSCGEDDVGISRCENVQKHSSTPTSEGHYTLPPIDESIIMKTRSFLQPPGVAIKNDTKKPSLQKNKATGLSSNVSVLPCDGEKSNQVNECDQSEINLLYAEYLQAKYVESMAMKALETRCEDALDRIYEVWCYVGVLMDRNLEVLNELITVNHFITSHEHLSKQEKILLPTLKIIPSLEKQFEEIAKAVNAARHNLEIKDIVLPDVDPEKGIVQLLCKSNSLLNEILSSVQDSSKIVTAAEAKHDFINQGKLISERLERVSDMLSEMSHLLVTETSLKLSLTD